MTSLPGDAVVFVRHGFVLVCTSARRPGFFLTITLPKVALNVYAEDTYQCGEYLTRIRKFADMID